MNIVYEFLTVTVVLSSFLGLGKSLSKILKLQESTIPLDGLLGAGVYAFSISILGHFFSLFEVTTVLIISGLVFFTFCLHKRWFNFQLSLPWVVVLYLILLVNVYQVHVVNEEGGSYTELCHHLTVWNWHISPLLT
jgi:hypothetical protein